MIAIKAIECSEQEWQEICDFCPKAPEQKIVLAEDIIVFLNDEELDLITSFLDGSYERGKSSFSQIEKEVLGYSPKSDNKINIDLEIVITEEVPKELSFEEIKEHAEKCLGIRFGTELRCTYGPSYVNSGEGFNFVMYQSVMITESKVISIIPHDFFKESQKFLDIFETRFLGVGTDEFDNIKEFYKIEGLKFP